MYSGFDELCRSVAADRPKTLVVAAAHDAHTLEAVYAAEREYPVRYILVGDREKIVAVSSQLGRAPDPGLIVDTRDDEESARIAVSLARDCGDGGVLMKGILDSGTLLRAVLDKDDGIRESGTLSHLAVLEVPGYHKLVGVTDGGMLPSPTLSQKADIARNAVSFYQRLGFARPKIAALCAGESVNAKITETVDAASLQEMCGKGELGDCLLEGPLSFDIAVSRQAAAIKGHSSEVSGDVDILLVPNITVGNAFCKALIYWGGAKMAGCVLGAAVPIVLVSRNATAEEKLYSILLSICGQPAER